MKFALVCSLFGAMASGARLEPDAAVANQADKLNTQIDEVADKAKKL